jgi:hypothetical protein
MHYDHLSLKRCEKAHRTWIEFFFSYHKTMQEINTRAETIMENDSYSYAKESWFIIHQNCKTCREAKYWVDALVLCSMIQLLEIHVHQAHTCPCI